MKKVVIAIAIMLSIFITQEVYAAPEAGALRGKALSNFRTTDGNDSTLWNVTSYNSTYTFPSLTEVTGVYFYASGDVFLQFYNSNNTLLGTVNPTGYASNSYRSFNYKDVKSVRLYGPSDGFSKIVYEIDVRIVVVKPPAPNKLKAIETKDYVNLSWESIEDATGYYVYKNGKKIDQLITTNSYKAAAENDVSLKWSVTAFNGLESDQSQEVTTFYDSIPPQKLNVVGEALPAGESVRLSWARTTDKDVDRYNVYRDNQLLEAVTNTQTTVQAEYNVMHDYKVTAVDTNNNESEESNVVSLKALLKRDLVAPLSPQNLIGTAKEGYVQLNWTANEESDLNGYYLYVNGAKYSDEIIKSNEMKVYGLQNNQSYRFKVAAVDLSENVSKFSNEITVKTLKAKDNEPPAAPKNLTAFLSSDYLSVNLSWGAVSDTDVLGYYVYVSTDDMVFNRINATPSANNSFNYKDIEGNQMYYFKVAAVDTSGNVSVQTKSVSIKVPTRDPNESTEKKKEIYVKWNEIKGATNYLIYFNGVLIATTDNQTFQFVIDEQYGYKGQPPAHVDVKAKFEDGSTGYDKNLATQSKWGFSVVDLWNSIKYVVMSVGGFLLLGIAIMFAPRVFKLIKEALIKRSR